MEVTIIINSKDHKPHEASFGIVANWPDNWPHMDKDLFEQAYWQPTIFQLRQEALNRK